MAFFAPRRVLAVLLVAVAIVYAEKHAASIASMSVPEIEEKLQVQARAFPFPKTMKSTDVCPRIVHWSRISITTRPLPPLQHPP